MGIFKTFAMRLGILGELFGFLWRNKRWWLIPLMALIVVIGLVLVISQSSAIGPFIYSLF